MTQKAILSITIPTYHNNSKPVLLRFVLGFPFSATSVVRQMWGWHKYGKLRGFFHANKIEPKHIAKFFEVTVVLPLYARLSWFKGRKGKLLQRLGVRVCHLPQTMYYVQARMQGVTKK